MRSPWKLVFMKAHYNFYVTMKKKSGKLKLQRLWTFPRVQQFHATNLQHNSLDTFPRFYSEKFLLLHFLLLFHCRESFWWLGGSKTKFSYDTTLHGENIFIICLVFLLFVQRKMKWDTKQSRVKAPSQRDYIASKTLWNCSETTRHQM